MINTTDGDNEHENGWELSVLQALGARNRVLGAIAVLSVLASLSTGHIAARRHQFSSSLDAPLGQDWSVDINQATAAQLQLIPGLGPKLASAVLDRRRELGGFQRIEQLADIPGIKQQRVQMLSRYLKITTEASSEASSGTNASSNSNRLSDLEHE